MPDQEKEGEDPAARKAAEEWRRTFGREGHEGSYAPHDLDSERKPEEGERRP